MRQSEGINGVTRAVLMVNESKEKPAPVAEDGDARTPADVEPGPVGGRREADMARMTQLSLSKPFQRTCSPDVSPSESNPCDA